jgi:hypothetical protein
LQIPRAEIEKFLPEMSSLEKQDLDKYIFVQSQLYGNKISEETEKKVLHGLKETEGKQIPDVINALVSCKIDNQKIWDAIRTILVNRIKNKKNPQPTIDSITNMGPYLHHKEF